MSTTDCQQVDPCNECQESVIIVLTVHVVHLESGGSRDGFSDLVLDSIVGRERDLIWRSPIFICSQTKLSFVMKARGCCPWSQICGRALAFIGCVASKGLCCNIDVQSTPQFAYGSPLPAWRGFRLAKRSNLPMP